MTTAIEYITCISKLQSLFDSQQIKQYTNQINPIDLKNIQDNIGLFVSQVNSVANLTQFKSSKLLLMNTLTAFRKFIVKYANNAELIKKGTLDNLEMLINIMVQIHSDANQNIFTLLTYILEIHYYFTNISSTNSITVALADLDKFLLDNINTIQASTNILTNLQTILKILRYFINNNNKFANPDDQLTYGNCINMVKTLTVPTQFQAFTNTYTVFDYVAKLGTIKTDLQNIGEITPLLDNLILAINNQISLNSLGLSSISDSIWILIQNRLVVDKYAQDPYFKLQNIVAQFKLFENYLLDSISWLNNQFDTNLANLLSNIIDISIRLQAYSTSKDPNLYNASRVFQHFYNKKPIDKIAKELGAIQVLTQQIQEVSKNLIPNYNTDLLEESLANLQSNLIIYAEQSYGLNDFIGWVVDSLNSQISPDLTSTFQNLMHLVNTAFAQNIQNVLFQYLTSIKKFVDSNLGINNQNLTSQLQTLSSSLIDLFAYDPDLKNVYFTVVRIKNLTEGRNDISKFLSIFNQFIDKLTFINGKNLISQDINTKLLALIDAQYPVWGIQEVLDIVNSQTLESVFNLNTTCRNLTQTVNQIFNDMIPISSNLNPRDPDIQTFAGLSATIFGLYFTYNSVISLQSLVSVQSDLFLNLNNTWTTFDKINSFCSANFCPTCITNLANAIIFIKANNGNIYKTIICTTLLLKSNPIQELSEILSSLRQKIDKLPKNKFYLLANCLIDLQNNKDQRTNLDSLNNILNPVVVMKQEVSKATKTDTTSKTNTTVMQTIAIIKPNSWFQILIIAGVCVLVLYILIKLA